MFVPIIFLWKHLYQWAAYPTAVRSHEALANHAVTLEQALTLNAKRAMLNPIGGDCPDGDHLRDSAGCSSSC